MTDNIPKQQRPPRKHNPAWPDSAAARTERSRKRVARLNEIAQELGYDSWRKLETAVLAGELVVIPA